ncbi:MAG: SDR family oxidoreductase [Bacteroidales bacterium]
MRKIVIDGANGYVASHFINELLIQNYEVVALVRDGRGNSSAERMEYALAEINNFKSINLKNLKVYSYSLLNEDFSISKEELGNIFNEKVDYFHFAACLKFSEKDRDEIFDTNVNGVENSIKTFLKYSLPESRFFFISTAYSCGKMPQLFEEKFYSNEDIAGFRNYYEQSKRFAENVVKKYIEKSNLNGYVIRLSQVTGDNKSGVTITDFGIFDFVKRVYNFSKRYPNETVRISVFPDSTQNLVSIDNIVTYFMRILILNELPSIIHFVGKKSIKNGQIIECICKLLPINIIQDTTLEKENMNAIEKIIAAGMSFTGGYTNTNFLFDTKNLDGIISSYENEVTVLSLYKMLEYFIAGLSTKKRSSIVISHSLNIVSI